MDLDNVVAVVTGGTTGIGWAIARDLLQAGARVAICGRTGASVDPAVESLAVYGDVVGAPCDVSDVAAVDGFADFVHRERGRPAILVNNAGLAHFAPVAETTIEQFDEVLAVNVRGVFLMTRAFLEDLRATQGHVVNIASLAGRNAVPNAAAYAAAKHAVVGFSKSFFAEVRQDGVRVTAVCPGSVVTSFFERAGGKGMLQRPETKLAPDDVAATVLATLRLPARALVSEVDIRPANP